MLNRKRQYTPEEAQFIEACYWAKCEQEAQTDQQFWQIIEQEYADGS